MIVLDACAICEIVRQTDRGQALLSLILNEECIISCELARAEIVSVFRKLTKTEHLGAQTAEQYIDAGLALVDRLYPLEPLQREAFRESVRLDHSSYDMFYFILARRMGATLFTTDKKLMRLCEEHGVDCIGEINLA